MVILYWINAVISNGIQTPNGGDGITLVILSPAISNVHVYIFISA